MTSLGREGTSNNALKLTAAPAVCIGYSAKPEQRCPPHSSAGEGSEGRRKRKSLRNPSLLQLPLAASARASETRPTRT